MAPVPPPAIPGAGSKDLLPEYTSLAGSWVLDKARSASMEAHLQCLGVAELAIEAQLKSEADSDSRVVIAIDSTRFVVHKRSKINILTEIYDINNERGFPCKSGTRHTVVRLKDKGSLASVVITSNMPTPTGGMRQVDTRTIYDKGLTKQQELYVTNVATGKSCITRRTWVRVLTTAEDIEALAEEKLSTPDL